MRDLARYQEAYAALPFETEQLRIRKRKLLEFLRTYRPRSILEIGCGMDPLFQHYDDFDYLKIVEPADLFFRNATFLASEDHRIEVVSGTLEDNVESLATHGYDFLIISSLLHEIADPSRILMSARTLCNATSIIHVNVPNAWSLHRVLAMQMGLINDVHQISDVQVRMQQAHTFDIESFFN